MEFFGFSGHIPPVDSPQWLKLRHLLIGVSCVVLTAAIMTGLLSDYMDNKSFYASEEDTNGDDDLSADESQLPFPDPQPRAFEYKINIPPAIGVEKRTQHDNANVQGKEPKENSKLNEKFTFQDWLSHVELTEKVLLLFYFSPIS